MSAPQIPVWTWRDAVRQAAVPPLTKLVCYSIANYLADVGQGCFPSIKTLIADTGLSNRSLATHIRTAVDAGLLIVERKTGRDGRYQLTHYLPRFPDNATLARRPAQACAAPSDAVAEVDDGHVKEIHADQPRVKEAHADRPSEAASPGEPPPREPDRVNLVTTGTIHRGNSKTPKSPQAGKNGGSSVDDKGTKAERLLAALHDWGRHRHVVEHLLAPLLDQRRFSAEDPVGALKAACGRCADLPQPKLAKVLALLLEGPQTVKEARLVAAIDAVKQAGLMLVIDRRAQSGQWAAWRRHFAASWPPAMLAKFDQSDRWQVPDAWPPRTTAADEARP